MSGSPFGILEAWSSDKASEAQVSAADQATQAQLDMFNKSRADQAPWVKAGAEAVGELSGEQGLIKKGPGEFIPEQEPGYKFGYQEFVENPTLKLAAATGKLGSGATLKALTRYASDYASTKYDNFLDRYYKRLDPYFRMAGLGSNVAIAGGNQATATGQGVARTTLASGAGQAAGYLGQANAYGGAMGQAGNLIGQYFTQNRAFNNASLPQYGGIGAEGTVSGTGLTAGEMNSMMWL